MQPDHTATEFAQPQPLLSTSVDGSESGVPQRPVRALTRITFCFAWLFGLEPFLTGSADDAPRSKPDHS
jgi:hypothetical protein